MAEYKIISDGQEYELEVRRDGGQIIVTHEGREYVAENTGDISAPVPGAGGGGAGAAAPAVPQAAPLAPAPAPIAPAAPAAAAGGGGAGAVTAPMTGVIKEIHAQVGGAVGAGELIITMEAMKMDVTINAPAAGTVSEILVEAGAAVQQGNVLVNIAPA